MTARLELLKVTRRAPDVRYHVRVITGEVSSGSVVLVKRGSLLIGHGRVARIEGGSGAPQRLRRGDEGELGFKVQTGLDQAARGDTLDAVEGDLTNALAKAVADEVAATPLAHRILMLPMRVVTAFGKEHIDGQLTGVLKVRAYPDVPHIVPGAGAWTDSDEAMARLYEAARTEGRAAEARAKEELIATVGPDHAARLMAGDRTERRSGRQRFPTG